MGTTTERRDSAREKRTSIVTFVTVVGLLVVAATFLAIWFAVHGTGGSHDAVTQSDGADSSKVADQQSDDGSRPHQNTSLSTLINEALSAIQAAPSEVLNTKEGVSLQQSLMWAALGGSSNPKNAADNKTRLATSLEAFEARQQAYDALLDKISELSEGGDVAVVVENLNTGSRLVSVQPEQVFTAASTYKLFVANSMIQAVDSGAWQWSDSLMDTTLEGCFNQMIIESDNDCPVAWMDAVGWENLDSSAAQLQAKNTSFEPSDLKTTAEDLSLALRLLNDPQTMSEDSRHRLFGAMQVQEYREGIPAALDSVGTVADKVGFLDSELHDAAIIRTPKGDFTMVIMSTDLTWDIIKQIAQAVYDYL